MCDFFLLDNNKFVFDIKTSVFIVLCNYLLNVITIYILKSIFLFINAYGFFVENII